MQQLNFQGEDKETLAIEFIREHEPKDQPWFVGYSGGKDSEVLLDLVKRSGCRYEAYYSYTGIDAPEVVAHVKTHPEVHICKPKESFFSLIPKKGYPTKWTRWCCDKIKKENTKHIPLKHRLMGIRAEESNRRAKRPMIDVISSSKKIQKLVREVSPESGEFSSIKVYEIVSKKTKAQIIYKPIFQWLEWEVWDYIDSHKLPYCSLYDEGFDRLGCVVCPFLNYRQHQRNMKRWPKIYNAFEKAMRKIWDKGKPSGEPWRESTFDEFLSNWYRGK